MKLRNLHIHQDYSGNGKFKGTIAILGQCGEIELNLSNEQADKIIRIVADELVESAKEVATALTAECIEYREQRVIEGASKY